MSGIPTRKYGDGSINAIKMTEALKLGRYAYYNGDHQPRLSAANGYGDPAGTTGTLAKMVCFGQFPLIADYFALGAGQTLLGPLLSTAGLGLEVSGDQTVDEGYEFVFGTLDVRGPHTFTVGTDNAFLRMKFSIEDVSDFDEVCVGFRKKESVNATLENYDEAAFLTVPTGALKCWTILNNAATTKTDCAEAWADGETHELMVTLIGRQVGFWYDGSPISGLPAFRFDANEVIVPFFRTMLDDTGAADATSLLHWEEVEVGLLNAINSDGYDSL
jgi:hypothetical protein